MDVCKYVVFKITSHKQHLENIHQHLCVEKYHRWVRHQFTIYIITKVSHTFTYFIFVLTVICLKSQYLIHFWYNKNISVYHIIIYTGCHDTGKTEKTENFTVHFSRQEKKQGNCLKILKTQFYKLVNYEMEIPLQWQWNKCSFKAKKRHRKC